MTLPYEHVVVIGASAGGVSALLEISAGLPARFPAPICIVQHIGSGPSLLPELLRFRAANHAMHVEDGQRLVPGTLYIAPPDRHLLVEGGTLRLTRGPKENHARPAIDPLFRTAAASFGPRVIGVILTGQMDDGTAGLQAIKECGGIAIVQDPQTAVEASMPRSAICNVDVDHVVPLEAIGPLLVELTARPVPAQHDSVPERVAEEVDINRGVGTVEKLRKIGTPSPLTCPDCGGGLWEVQEARPLRYRCHVGHAYTALSLEDAQKTASEEALWSAMRALREREMLLRRMAGIAASLGDENQAAVGSAEADRVKEQVLKLRELAESVPGGRDA